jgi:hypothetical protein
MTMLMTKKLFERPKMTKKMTLSRTLKMTKKNEPGTGGEKPRSGRFTRSVYDGSREAELA